MIRITHALDQITRSIGKLTSWLSIILICVIILDVFLRYVFNITSVASGELEWHLFAALFLLSAGWALGEDKHVRVDVFYVNFSKKKKAWVNLIGTLLLLLPFSTIAILESLQFVSNSFGMSETSPDPGGLPARYIIKSMIPMGFILLFIQGISEVIKSIKTIRQNGLD